MHINQGTFNHLLFFYAILENSNPVNRAQYYPQVCVFSHPVKKEHDDCVSLFNVFNHLLHRNFFIELWL